MTQTANRNIIHFSALFQSTRSCLWDLFIASSLHWCDTLKPSRQSCKLKHSCFAIRQATPGKGLENIYLDSKQLLVACMLCQIRTKDKKQMLFVTSVGHEKFDVIASCVIQEQGNALLLQQKKSYLHLIPCVVLFIIHFCIMFNSSDCVQQSSSGFVSLCLFVSPANINTNS